MSVIASSTPDVHPLTVAIAYIRHLLQSHGERTPTPPLTVLPPPLVHLCNIFQLSDFERDLLLLCAAVELEADLAALCAIAQGDPQRPYPTFSLALAILPDAHWSALTPSGALRRWRLIELGAGNVLTTSPLRIDEQILHLLVGSSHFNEQLTDLGGMAASTMALVPTHQELATQLARTWYLASKAEPLLPILQLCSKDAASQRAIAATACTQLNLVPYLFSVESLPADLTVLSRVQCLWDREYLLNRAAILLEWDEREVLDPKQQAAVTRFIDRIQAPTLLLSQTRHRQQHRSMVTFEATSPTPAEQRALWTSALSPLMNDLNGQIDHLVSHFNFSAAAIRSASLKMQTDAEETTLTHAHLWQICRAQSRPRLDELAQRIDSRASWDELVLPDQERQVLQDVATQLKQRQKVYEQWGFGDRGQRGLGISALFAGASGTGKTLAAEVLANDLHLDLYRIDLSAVVSKYIGETEKNLGRVFDAAEVSGVILLFDEADSLFGKRSDVKDSHDRYANMEVSYLLQRMEAYRGLAVLTTNLKGSIDQAFLRRIRFIVQFPFPDATQRAEIWRRVFPAQTPTQGLDPIKLARLNIAGGNIRNIVLNAAFIAAEANQPIQMAHLLQAARSEYTKLERPLTDAEIKGWV